MTAVDPTRADHAGVKPCQVSGYHAGPSGTPLVAPAARAAPGRRQHREPITQRRAAARRHSHARRRAIQPSYFFLVADADADAGAGAAAGTGRSELKEAATTSHFPSLSRCITTSCLP